MALPPRRVPRCSMRLSVRRARDLPIRRKETSRDWRPGEKMSLDDVAVRSRATKTHGVGFHKSKFDLAAAQRGRREGCHVVQRVLIQGHSFHSPRAGRGHLQPFAVSTCRVAPG